MFDWMAITKQTFKQVLKDDCMGTAAEMAYHFMLSFFPAIIFLLSFFSLFAQTLMTIQSIINFLVLFIPGMSTSQNKLVYIAILSIIQGGSGQLAIIGFITALFTSSNGALTIIKGINQAYTIPTANRSIWRTQLLAILIVLSFGLVLLLTTNLIFITTHFMHFIQSTLGIWNINLYALEAVRWALAIIGIILFSTMVYALTPWCNRQKPLNYRQALPGGFVFVGLWFVFSVLFRLYADHFAQYNKVYGLLAGVIIFMTWLYLSSLALLIGGEVNSQLFRKHYESKPS